MPALVILVPLKKVKDTEVRRMLKLIFWGLAKMTQKVLPVMRKQRSGHIIEHCIHWRIERFPWCRIL